MCCARPMERLEEVGGGSRTPTPNRGVPQTPQQSPGGLASPSSNNITGATSGKIVSRNANNTAVLTSVPTNEAELQLYRVMQRASLLAYYDTLLEMGGDDLQQLCDAGEEEFLEIMALVGMASKPLHVRRLQKALHEWVSNGEQFKRPLTAAELVAASQGGSTNNSTARPMSSSSTVLVCGGGNLTPGSSGNLTPVMQTSAEVLRLAADSPDSAGARYALSPGTTCDYSSQQQLPQSTSPGGISLGHWSTSPTSVGGASANVSQLLTPPQIARIASAAEGIAKCLPKLEPRPHNNKKRACRDLDRIIDMAEDDPLRMPLLRRFAAIYGRFDCKRRPEKPLTLHELCVNEAAAQLCRKAPALLTRRDELFPLARRLVRDVGIGPAMQMTQQHQQGVVGTKHSRHEVPSDIEAIQPAMKRHRSSGSLTGGDVNAGDRLTSGGVRQNLLDSDLMLTRPDLASMFSERTRCFDGNDSKIAYFANIRAGDSDDTDSRYSYSNSSSPPLQIENGTDQSECGDSIKNHKDTIDKDCNTDLQEFNENKVQIIAAKGDSIIAVANPALLLSKTIVLSNKENAEDTPTLRERMSPVGN